MCVVFSNTLQMTYLKITSSEGYWKILCLGLNILYKAWEKVLKNTLSWAQYIMHHSFKQQSQENNFKKTYPNCNFPFKIFLDKRLYHCIGNKLPFPYHSVWCSIPHGVFVWSCGPHNHNFFTCGVVPQPVTTTTIYILEDMWGLILKLFESAL